MAKRKLPKNTAPPPGRGTGTDGSPAAVKARAGRSTDDVDRGKEVVERRHADWWEHQLRWRFLLDSYEGGERYRNAVYGSDRKGMPIRNLTRHRREYPDPQQFGGTLSTGFPGPSSMVNDGSAGVGVMVGPWAGSIGADPSATDQDDVFEMRRARTPVPEFVAEAIGIHLGKVYDQEVDRDGPDELTTWWKDVDGKGTTVDDYMRETVGPLLMALGNLDVLLDHPKVPAGERVVTRADEKRLGLDACVMSYYLPENVLWWKLDAADRYVEVLVREYVDAADRDDTDDKGNKIDPEGKSAAATQWRRNNVRYRHWTATESTLYSHDGSEVLETIPHTFGRVPMVRLIDLKNHRTSNVGKCRNEKVAELQRAYYNLDSEIILNGILQGHPFLSGPSDFLDAEETISVGPQYILPMKHDVDKGGYQGWEYVGPTNDPSDAMRANQAVNLERIDRAACLTKPAGAAGTGSSTVSQSGVSKQLDATTGHKLLVSMAKALAKAEKSIAEYALLVLRDRPVTPADRESIELAYPARFDLNDAATLIDGTTKLQLVMEACGNAPETEGALIGAAVRQLLVGLDDDVYEAIDAEIELLIETKSKIKEQTRELMTATTAYRGDVLAGGGGVTDENDPTGQAGGTQVSGNVMA